MKVLIPFLVTLVCSQAIDIPSDIINKVANTIKGDKGDAVQKRAPVLGTVTPTPGVEYADNTENHQEKSPSQQIYATPVPQVAKISDVLSGHGLAFPAAIASHLFSPVSVYQQKLGSPTTFEVSAPIPSQLAYSEHKMFQQIQNAVQYNPKQYQAQPQPIARLNFGYNQQQSVINQPDSVFIQPQPILYAQHQIEVPVQQVQVPSQIYQVPVNNFNVPQGIYLQNQIQNGNPQNQVLYQRNQIQQPIYNGQYQQQLVYQQPQQFYREQENIAAKPQLQRNNLQAKIPINQLYHGQNYQNQNNQGAVSYASFSQSQPSTNYNSQPNARQPVQYNQPQKYEQPNPSEAQRPQIIYLRSQTSNQNQLPVHPNFQLQIGYPNIQNQGNQYQHFGFSAALPVAPTFAPVQYFGKYAQDIFGGRKK